MNRYDKAFKAEAVRLSDEIGPSKAVEQLGVGTGNDTSIRQPAGLIRQAAQLTVRIVNSI